MIDLQQPSITSQFSYSKCPRACAQPTRLFMYRMHKSVQEQLQPRFLTLHNGPQHSFISLLEPLFGNQLATKPLKYFPSFYFLSYVPGEQQAPRAWNSQHIWSIMHGPSLSPTYPLARWFHPSCEVPEPVFSCIPSALVATGSSLQPQVIQPVDQVLVWAVGNRL